MNEFEIVKSDDPMVPGHQRWLLILHAIDSKKFWEYLEQTANFTEDDLNTIGMALGRSITPYNAAEIVSEQQLASADRIDELVIRKLCLSLGDALAKTILDKQ